MIDTATAARKLGISASRVRRLCIQGRIPGARFIGRVWFLPEAPTITPGAKGPPSTARKLRG